MIGTADGAARTGDLDGDDPEGPKAREAGGQGGRPAAAPAAGADARPWRKSPLVVTFGPLVLDVAVPVGGYYLLRDGFGTSLVMALALSSVPPALRAAVAAVREREFNGMAGLMVVVNVVSIALSFLTGDPRLMVAKDSGITSVVGIATLCSGFRGTPVMSAGLKPMITRGRADRLAAWDRLTADDPAFRRLERRFSKVWGVVLIAECAARVVGAYTLPVDTMVWMGNVIVACFISFGIVLGGAVAVNAMDRKLKQAAAAAS
jgi:hypothetical protein